MLAEMETFDQRSAIASRYVAGGRRRRRSVETARATLAETKQKVDARAGARRARRRGEERPRRSRRVADVARAAGEGRRGRGDARPRPSAPRSAVNLRERTVVAPIDGDGRRQADAAGRGRRTRATRTRSSSSSTSSRSSPRSTSPRTASSTVKIGGPADIVLDAYPDRHFRGEVVEFGKRVDRSKATLVVKVKFDDPMDGVLPEMSARVSFLSAPIERRRAEGGAEEGRRGRRGGRPRRAQGRIRDRRRRRGAGGAGHARRGPVGSSVELVDGPAGGARVVSSPPPELADGMKIKEKGS